MDERLAILGGPKAVTLPPGNLFTWPIVTKEDENAVLAVLRRGAMSGNDVTLKFEAAWAQFVGCKHALTFCNGTASLLAAMWACGVDRGSEVIAPSLVYWASALPALSLGATINFADVDAESLCIDSHDIEHRIGPRTRAIVVTHNYGHPCQMDRIMAIARSHNVKVIEDVSHAHGGMYRGRKLGSIGDVGCASMMTGKSFPIGEGGMLMTNNRLLWERAIAFGFYERTAASRFATSQKPALTDPGLLEFAGMPQGGVKHRINQTCSAMGLTQLKRYPKRMAEIDRAMNYFCDMIEGIPGIRPIRPKKGSRSTMGGWYCAVGHYRPQELGNLPIAKFIAAVKAEGCVLDPCPNTPMHLHPLLHSADIYGDGKPTTIAHATRDVRQGRGSLPVSEAAKDRVFRLPWFKKHRPRIIRQYAAAIRKVCQNHQQLLTE